jgi:polar amino acid transport system substrate-binding protein
MRYLLLLCFGTLLSNSIFAEPLLVVGNINLPPMSYLEDGTAKGFGVEITQAVLEEAGVNYQIRLMPWARAYEMAKNNKGVVFGMYWTKERADIFDYTDSLWEEKIVLVTKKGKEFPFQNIYDLRGKKIVLQRRTRPGDEFSEALNKNIFKIVANNDPISRLKLLSYERADAGVFNPGAAAVSWNARLAGLKFEDFTVLAKPLAVEEKHIGFAKSSVAPELLDDINKAIKKLTLDGTIKRIKQKYEVKTEVSKAINLY